MSPAIPKIRISVPMIGSELFNMLPKKLLVLLIPIYVKNKRLKYLKDEQEKTILNMLNRENKTSSKGEQFIQTKIVK